MGREAGRAAGRDGAAGALSRWPRLGRLAGITTAVALATCTLLPEGCGRKAPPRPPQFVRPRRIDDLVATPLTGGIRLTWTRPTETVDGSDMPDLDGIVIRRAVVMEPSAEVDDLAFETIAIIHLDDRERFAKARRMSYDDRTAVAGRTYVYRVVAFTLDRYFSVPSAPTRARWTVSSKTPSP